MVSENRGKKRRKSFYLDLLFPKNPCMGTIQVMKWLDPLHVQYRKHQLDRSQLAPTPMMQFASWYELAELEEFQPCALCLSTCGIGAQPSARMVLMKYFDEEGICFFTHYDSRKGREIAENPKAVAVFYWPSLDRQVIFACTVEQVEEELSDQYFYSRPFESQVAASTLHQGQPIGSREEMIQSFCDGVEKSSQVTLKRPPWWGGYRLKPYNAEFWQGREHRLHDRFEYTRSAGDPGAWIIQRICP